jgi:hypothetical protein
MNKTTKEIVQLYINEISVKYHPNTQVRMKDESKLLRLVRPFVELFNKRFWDGYVTTIGNTIWVPPKWFENGDAKSRLQLIAHETIHIRQSKKWTSFLFKVLYLFPQSFVVFSLLSFLAIPFGPHWLWCLLFILCLTPLPAPFRYMFELEAYRVKLIFFRHAWKTTPEMVQWAKDGIIQNLAKSDYYFTWPFVKTIQNDLDNEEKLTEEQYEEIVAFLKRHNLSADN